MVKTKETPAMTLTKSHLIDAIAKQNGFIKKQSSETFETILELTNQPSLPVKMS